MDDYRPYRPDDDDDEIMIIEREKLTKAVSVDGIANAFEPEPLSTPEEMRDFYVETMAVRTGNPDRSPIHELEKACKFPREHNAMLLLGHRGCGKSTELNKMRLRFVDEKIPVEIIQCEDRLPLLNQPEFSDILILMGDGLLRAAVKYGVEIPEKTLRMIQTFWLPAEKHDADGLGLDVSFQFPGMEVTLTGLENVRNLFNRMTENVKYNNLEVRQAYRSRLINCYEDWRRVLRRLSDSIWKKTGRQPVLIFEGLDHMENLAVAKHLFFEHAGKLTDVSFPVIYTFPIALYYDEGFASVEHLFSQVKVFPMMKLHTEDGGPYPEGPEQLRRIVERRAEPGVIDDDALKLMIEKSGGSLRDLFDAIRNAGEMASFRQSRTGSPRESVTKQDAEQALHEVRSRLTRRIEQTDQKFLIEICQGNHSAIGERKEYLKLLQARAVLEYGEYWFDVHPLVRDYLVKLGYVKDESVE